MKTRLVYFMCAIMLVVGAMTLLRASVSANAAPMAASSVTWTDNFTTSSLDSRWSWVRENNSHWSLTARPDFLRITTEAGGLWGTLGNQRNLLLTTTPRGDFRVTTKVSFAPTQFVQNAGLIVYQDDDNYIRLNRQYIGENVVELIQEIAGSPTFSYVVESANTVYLQIQREGNSYTGYYSTDGANWPKVGQYTVTLISPKMGIGASNEGAGLPELPADFDFIQLQDETHYLFLPAVLK